MEGRRDRISPRVNGPSGRNLASTRGFRLAAGGARFSLAIELVKYLQSLLRHLHVELRSACHVPGRATQTLHQAQTHRIVRGSEHDRDGRVCCSGRHGGGDAGTAEAIGARRRQPLGPPQLAASPGAMIHVVQKMVGYSKGNL